MKKYAVINSETKIVENLILYDSESYYDCGENKYLFEIVNGLFVDKGMVHIEGLRFETVTEEGE